MNKKLIVMSFLTVLISANLFANSVKMKIDNADVSVNISNGIFTLVKPEDQDIIALIDAYFKKRLNLEELAKFYDPSSVNSLLEIKNNPESLKGWNRIMSRVETIQPIARIEDSGNSWVYILINKGFIDERLQVLGLTKNAEGKWRLRHASFSASTPS